LLLRMLGSEAGAGWGVLMADGHPRGAARIRPLRLHVQWRSGERSGASLGPPPPHWGIPTRPGPFAPLRGCAQYQKSINAEQSLNLLIRLLYQNRRIQV